MRIADRLFVFFMFARTCIKVPGATCVHLWGMRPVHRSPSWAKRAHVDAQGSGLRAARVLGPQMVNTCAYAWACVFYQGSCVGVRVI